MKYKTSITVICLILSNILTPVSVIAANLPGSIHQGGKCQSLLSDSVSNSLSKSDPEFVASLRFNLEQLNEKLLILSSDPKLVKRLKKINSQVDEKTNQEIANKVFIAVASAATKILPVDYKEKFKKVILSLLRAETTRRIEIEGGYEPVNDSITVKFPDGFQTSILARYVSMHELGHSITGHYMSLAMESDIYTVMALMNKMDYAHTLFLEEKFSMTLEWLFLSSLPEGFLMEEYSRLSKLEQFQRYKNNKIHLENLEIASTSSLSDYLEYQYSYLKRYDLQSLIDKESQ